MATEMNVDPSMVVGNHLDPKNWLWADLTDHLWKSHQARPAGMPDIRLRRRLADVLHEELHDLEARR